jgi:hypothetical protein
MTHEPRIDTIARLTATQPRRPLLAGITAAVAAALLGLHPHHALAACKNPGQKCVKNQDCCDGARCKQDRCECKGSRDACGNDCVKLNTDEKHCGRCSKKCRAGETCRDGKCEGPCGGRTCDATEECIGGVCTMPGGGCLVGNGSCTSGDSITCNGQNSCFCLQSTEGTTHCGDLTVANSTCGQCQSSADCASFGAGVFCNASCCSQGGRCVPPCG